MLRIAAVLLALSACPAQAALDARLAWAMSDSPFLRKQAAALYRRSADLDLSALSMKQ